MATCLQLLLIHYRDCIYLFPYYKITVVLGWFLWRIYHDIEELIKDYETEALHPSDLKSAIARALNKILQVKIITKVIASYFSFTSFDHIGNCVAACPGPFQDKWGCYEAFEESKSEDNKGNFLWYIVCLWINCQNTP